MTNFFLSNDDNDTFFHRNEISIFEITLYLGQKNVPDYIGNSPEFDFPGFTNLNVLKALNLAASIPK